MEKKLKSNNFSIFFKFVLLFFSCYTAPLLAQKINTLSINNGVGFNNNLALLPQSYTITDSDYTKTSDGLYILDAKLDGFFYNAEPSHLGYNFELNLAQPFSEFDYSSVSQFIAVNFTRSFNNFSYSFGIIPQFEVYDFKPFYFGTNLFSEIYFSYWEQWLTNLNVGLTHYKGLSDEADYLNGISYYSGVSETYYFDTRYQTYALLGLTYEIGDYPALDYDFFTFNFGYQSINSIIEFDFTLFDSWTCQGSANYSLKNYNNQDVWQDSFTGISYKKKRTDFLSTYELALNYFYSETIEVKSFLSFSQNLSNFNNRDTAGIDQTFVQLLSGISVNYYFINKDLTEE